MPRLKYVPPSQSIILSVDGQDVTIPDSKDRPETDLRPIDPVTSRGGPNSYDELRTQAMFAAQCNQYLTAIIRFTRIEFNYGLRIQDRYHRAFASLGRKHHEFALADGLAMIEDNSQNYRGYWIAGIAYERLRQYDNARDIYLAGVAKLNELLDLNGKAFSGLASGKMVLTGCIDALDTRSASDIPKLVEITKDLTIEHNPAPDSIPTLKSSDPQLHSNTRVDPAKYFPLEIMLQIFDYIELDFRDVVRLEVLGSAWRRVVRSVPRYWQTLDLRAVNWGTMTKEIIDGYVGYAAGVKQVYFNWVVPNAGQDRFDELWYELVWWIASLERSLTTSEGSYCSFNILACVPYLSKDSATNGMLAIPWGPERTFQIPQNLVAALLCALTLRKSTRATNMKVFDLPIDSLVRQLSWEDEIEPGWELDEFSHV